MPVDSIAVAIPTITPHGLLDSCLTSLIEQATILPHILVIQNSPHVAPACANWEARGVTIHRPAHNLGVAASWNHAARWAWAHGHSAILLLNDDIALEDRTTLQQLAQAAADEPRRLYCLIGRGFSAVCLSQRLWDEVGPFDDGFWPAYYEDNDMHRRLKLAGIPALDIDHPSVHFGSAAIRTDGALERLNRIAFPLNQRRYAAKWGGLPDAERYDVPWNGAAAWPSVRDLVQGAAATG